jgi:hypothetical protein
MVTARFWPISAVQCTATPDPLPTFDCIRNIQAARTSGSDLFDCVSENFTCSFATFVFLYVTSCLYGLLSFGTFIAYVGVGLQPYYGTIKIMSKFLAAVTLAFASLVANAAPIHSLGDQTPTGFATNNIFSGNARGWEFTAGANDILISELGIAPASGGSYTMSLWDVATQSVLGQTTLSNVSAGQWNWANLTAPVALSAGASYLVVGIGNDSNQSYYYSNNLPQSWYPSGDINYTKMVFCNACTANSYPTNSLSNFQYGLVDVGYTEGSNVPEPSSILLFGLGALALGSIRHRKSA